MRIGLNRRNVGRLVLLGWAAALAWLARRELYRGEAATTALGATRLAPGTSYYAIKVRGRQIGQLNLSVDTLIDGYRISELVALDLPGGDSTRQIARSAEYELTRSLRIRSVTTRVFGWGPADQTEATVGEDSILSVRVRDGTDEVTGATRYRMRAEAVLPALVPFRVAFGGRMEVGRSTALLLFDPATGETRPLRVAVTAESTFVVADSATWDPGARSWVTVTADTAQGWRIEHQAGDAPMVAWVDASGSMLRAEIANGVVLERSAFEIVRNNYRATLAGQPQGWRDSLPGFRSLVSARRIPDTTATERHILVRRDSAALAGLPVVAAGGRQEVRGDTIVVRRRTPPDSAAPAPEGLFPSADVPIGQHGIGRTARMTLAGLRGRRGAGPTRADSAAALTRWVARQIATDTATAASGSVALALRARRGSPDAKARLLASLARTARIPARVVSGLAVLPQGSFTHSWTELWVDGWVAADPTFGHYPASASLVRLTTGGRSRPVDLVPLAASAQFLPLPPVR